MSDPFDTDCMKCGSPDVYRRYYAEGAKIEWSALTPCDGRSSEYVSRERRNWVAKKECVVHTCRCCGFYWDGPVKG